MFDLIGRPAVRKWSWCGALLFACQSVCSVASAQNDEAPATDRFRESVSLETSRQAARQLSTAALQAHESRWQEAVDELERVTTAEGVALVPLSPGRYVNVRLYANLMLASLPAEALAVYRKSADPSARLWYEEGRSRGDSDSLLRVVNEAFASSFGDDALLLLGERAWERGDVGAARRFWEQILPLTRQITPGEVLPVLRYPDTDLDRAQILARLVLCSLAEGNRFRAKRELDAFSRLYPESEGTLAGRSGRLAGILAEIAHTFDGQSPSRRTDDMPTFAVNAQRNGILQNAFDIGAIRWRTKLDRSFQPQKASHPFLAGGELSTFPVIVGQVVFFNDSRRIFAYDCLTGKPMWPSGDDNSAVIFEAGGPRKKSLVSSVVGIPRYTLTESDGRLYARMGSPITGQSQRELRTLESQIVCLDIKRGEGKLLWRAELKEQGEGWAFEGTPTCVGGRLYVPLRSGFPQTQTNVACLDAATGTFVWNRRVCAAVSDASQVTNLVSHHLLTFGDDALFYSTDMGAIAAFSAADGMTRWVTTYESIAPRMSTESASDYSENLTPCLYHDGTVIAAPSDYDGLLALDAQTGRILWRRRLPGGVRHLLGVGTNTLVVSGDSLWGLDLNSGTVLWEVGGMDPVSHGYGQGLLAGNLVYWPTRETILLVDQSTGSIERRIDLAAMHAASGGNLAMADDCLIVAGSEEIIAFGKYGRIRPPAPEWISAAD